MGETSDLPHSRELGSTANALPMGPDRAASPNDRASVNAHSGILGHLRKVSGSLFGRNVIEVPINEGDVAPTAVVRAIANGVSPYQMDLPCLVFPESGGSYYVDVGLPDQEFYDWCNGILEEAGEDLLSNP